LGSYLRQAERQETWVSSAGCFYFPQLIKKYAGRAIIFAFA